MTIAMYPAHLSPYPSDRLVSVRRVDPQHYPTSDGVCLKVGPFGLSIGWRRRARA